MPLSTPTSPVPSRPDPNLVGVTTSQQMARSAMRWDCRAAYVQLGLPSVPTYGDAGLGLLGDPTRRAIFELLARGPRSVQQLADQLPISRPAVSQHLRVLKDGGLVVSHAEGNRRIYSLNPEGVTALRAWLDGVWSDALAGFHKVAETATPPDPGQEIP
jgi:DNA-binding transcriptional ArsR family regulator